MKTAGFLVRLFCVVSGFLTNIVHGGRCSSCHERDKTVTDASLLISEDYAHKRQQLRLERQARVGILRNLNAPPRPPMRRANLMGKWMNLRSSRRPKSGQVITAIEAIYAEAGIKATSVENIVQSRDDGTVESIDISSLMSSVANLGTSAPVRNAFGANMRPDREIAPLPVAPAPEPSILSRDAWLDHMPTEDEVKETGQRSDEAVATALRPPRYRALLSPALSLLRNLFLVVLGLFLALAILTAIQGMPMMN